ncbi:hypothetical protein FQV11_0012032, partial [Eudyptes moseleyi]
VLLGSGLTVLSQPLMYVKVLVQVGYEPLPPTLGRNVFGRQVYQLPGLFAYAKHIVKVDGRAGLFKGLTPRLCSSAIGTVVHGKVLQRGLSGGGSSPPDASFPLQPGASKKEPVSSLEQVLKEVRRRRVLGSARVREGLVITLRCMVQFIGRETKYSGTLSAFTTIYREEGVLGFFAGAGPHFEVAARLRGGLKAPFLLPQVSTMAEMKSYSQAVTGFFASMLTYPFVLVSNLMAVNNCGLAGGLLPYAPTYSSWLDCWSQLHREGNMSRGNSLFFRKVPTGKRYVWE